MNSQEKLNSEKKVFTRVPCCKTERNTTKICITLLIVMRFSLFTNEYFFK